MNYVALLRGIGPLNPNMRNEKLRGVVESLGFRDVQTVISSGNVVFETGRRDVSALEARIEAAWPAQLGFRSTTIVRSRAEIEELVRLNPFGERADTPTTSCQVTFLKRQPEPDLDVSDAPTTGGYAFVAVVGREICSVVDRSGPGTPDLMRRLEKQFGKEITTRTWNTVHRILRKLS